MTGGESRYFYDDINNQHRGINLRMLLLILILSSLFSLAAEAQRKSDIGFYTGISYYMGELNAYKPFYMPSLALGPIFRYNFNNRHSIRAHALFNNLRGYDENFRVPDNEFAASFVDLGANFEFNWWPYKTAFRKTKYSPYVMAGLGYNLNYAGGSVSHLNVPFGIGLKVNMGKRLSGGIEHAVMKTFNDGIDGQYNVGREDSPAFFGNSDWYMFTGVFLTYKIFEYREDCPTYEENTNTKRR